MSVSVTTGRKAASVPELKGGGSGAHVERLFVVACVVVIALPLLQLAS